MTLLKSVSRMRLRAASAPLALTVAFGLSLIAIQSLQAQTFTVLHSFTGGPDGAYPYAGLLRDTSGNLYSTTAAGGSSNQGTVFEVDASGTETVLHSFSGADGVSPYAGVIMDAKGDLYGSTQYGGSGCSGTGCGTVFELTPKAGGGWTETVLFEFAFNPHGAYPFGLIRDAKGDLYGATEAGGTGSNIEGTVFKVSTAGKETVLHSFTGSPSDGAFPELAGVVMDANGDLYGDTFEGGDSQSSAGVVYRLAKSGALTVLYSFSGGADGFAPMGTPVMDKHGNLYGTTYRGGSFGYGCVWKLSQKGKETVLHSFVGGELDGSLPEAGVVLDAQGNLYGVTTEGGSGSGTACGKDGCGTVYELSKDGTLTLLHRFTGSDGEYPVGGLILDANRNLYGTAQYGGSDDYGTVWKLTP